MKLFLLATILNLSLIKDSPSIYEVSVTTASGKPVMLKEFKGKKLLVIVLPFTNTSADSSFLHSVDLLSRNNIQKLQVIAVPSVDDGLFKGDLPQRINFYTSILGSQVIITTPMYTRKGAGTIQHSLFSWLTHKEKNLHFDIDVNGPGDKFIINESGELVGVFHEDLTIKSKSFARLLQ
ncbi:MAG: hypothetical protein ACM3VS_03190 [Candidatus Dadabacteria bacterium]